MKVAEYPNKKCRQPMTSPSGLGYSCELPLQHTGPHATYWISGSVTARDRWEEAHPDEAGKFEPIDVIIHNNPNRGN